MRINNHYKTISFVLVFLSVLSFFIGFIYGENSAGAGTFNGDFVNLWKNLQSFLNNDLKTAIPPFIVATIISLIIVYFLEKKIPMVPLTSGILVTFFGGLTKKDLPRKKYRFLTIL